MRYYHLGCYAFLAGVSMERVYAHSATLQHEWQGDCRDYGGPGVRCAFCERPIPDGMAYTTEAYWVEMAEVAPARHLRG
jgi:hypothetical protein